MQVKLKICDGCQKPKPIWKSEGRKKFCKECWSWQTKSEGGNVKLPKQNPIRPRSSKREKLDRAYSVLRQQYLLNHHMCEIHLPGCTLRATDIHHTYSGKDRSKYYLDTTTWKAVCRFCHDWIHDNANKAREMNYLK